MFVKTILNSHQSLIITIDVTPTINPQLTKFCTDLTGITQDMVTNQPILADVLTNFHTWLKNENLLQSTVKFIFVTCGDWDLFTMLRSQCDYFRLPRAEYFNHWINIKKSFNKAIGKDARDGMMGMLKDLNIPHTGRHHSGIDDCKNIAEVLKGLAERGYVFEENRKN
jgi:ERI1 exoribonuclease 3